MSVTLRVASKWVQAGPMNVWQCSALSLFPAGSVLRQTDISNSHVPPSPNVGVWELVVERATAVTAKTTAVLRSLLLYCSDTTVIDPTQVVTEAMYTTFINELSTHLGQTVTAVKGVIGATSDLGSGLRTRSQIADAMLKAVYGKRRATDPVPTAAEQTQARANAVARWRLGTTANLDAVLALTGCPQADDLRAWIAAEALRIADTR